LQLHFLVNLKYKFTLATLGYYNIYNALAAITVARIFGMGYEEIAFRLANFDFPRGRLRTLKINNITFIDDQPHMTLSAYFSFNDMGSRVLAQTCEEDCLVPRYETSIQLKIEDGRLIFPDSLSKGEENLIVTNEAGEVVSWAACHKS